LYVVAVAGWRNRKGRARSGSRRDFDFMRDLLNVADFCGEPGTP
jgi:hypothetical protein